MPCNFIKPIVANRKLLHLGQSRKLASLIFDRNLKARQKLWAIGQKDCYEAAGGLRNEIETRIFEKVKVLSTICFLVRIEFL